MCNFNQYARQMPPDLNELCIEFILLNDENKSARQHVYKSSRNFETLIKITQDQEKIGCKRARL